MTHTTNMTAEDAVAAERQRCLSLIDLHPESGVSAAVVTAITEGQSAEDFAIGVVQAAKAGGRGERAVSTAARLGHPALAHMATRTSGER